MLHLLGGGNVFFQTSKKDCLGGSGLVWAVCSVSMRAAEVAGWGKMRLLLLLLVAAVAVALNQPGGVPSKRLKMQYATGPLLKFQICVS